VRAAALLEKGRKRKAPGAKALSAPTQTANFTPGAR